MKIKSWAGLSAKKILNQLGQRENRWWIAGLLATLTLLGGLHFLTAGQKISLRLDMEVSAGETLEVYINENNRQPLQQHLVLNQRQIYRIENLPGLIRMIRIDPTDADQARVKLYGVSLHRRGREVARLSPARLVQWSSMNIQSSLQADHVEAHALTADPYLYERQNYYLLPLPRFLHQALSKPADLLLGVFLLGLGLLLALSRPVWRVTWVPLILVGSLILLSRPLALLLLNGSASPPAGLPAIGNAIYAGYYKILETRAFWAMFVLGVLLAGLAAYAVRALAPVRSAAPVSGEAENLPAFSYAFLGILLLILVLNFPPLQAHFAALPHIRHVPTWDGLNLLTWQFLVNGGWLPYRDFWYPYAGFYNMSAPFPWDMFRLHIHNILVFGGLVLAIYTLLRRDKMWTLLVLSLIWLAHANHLIVSPNRYFISLNLILLFAALHELRGNRRWPYALYGAYLAWALTRTPPQLIFAGLPVTVLITLKFWRLPDRAACLEYARKLGILSAAAAIGFGLFFIILALRGQFSGYLDFYTHLGGQTIANAIPTNLREWVQPGFNLDSVLLFSILGASALGVYLATRSRRGAEAGFGDLMLALGLLGALVYQKLLVRPGMASQMIGYYIVAGLLLLHFWSRTWSRTQQRVFIVWAAGLGFLLFALGGVQPAVRAFVQNAVHLPPNAAVLFQPGRVIQENQAAYFSSRSLSGFSGVPEFVRWYRTFRAEHPRGRFYVLGDEAYFYIATRQEMPYCITAYNAADIQDQMKIVRWLEDKQVERVVWNPKLDRFDGVPHQIRVPLLYLYVLEHYTRLSSFGDFQVLRRRAEGETFDWSFWEKNLGQSVDLGYLPAGACAPKLKACTGNGNLCHQFLEIKVAAPAADQPLIITLQAGEKTFQVTFRQSQGQSRYVIYLNRLWFWDTLSREGLRPSLSADRTEGVHLTIFKKKAQNKYLY